MENIGSLDAQFLTEQLNSFSVRRFQLYLALLVNVFNARSKLESALVICRRFWIPMPSVMRIFERPVDLSGTIGWYARTQVTCHRQDS